MRVLARSGSKREPSSLGKHWKLSCAGPRPGSMPALLIHLQVTDTTSRLMCAFLSIRGSWMNEVDKAMDSVEQHDLYGQREVPIDHARVLAAEVRRLRAMLKGSDQQYSCFECVKLTRCPSPRNGMPTDGATPVCFEYKSADLEPTPDARELVDYDPNCILCRRGAGKADAGLSEDDLCHDHLATALREAQAEVVRLRKIVEAGEALVKEWDILPAEMPLRIEDITEWLHRYLGPQVEALRAALEAAKGEG